MAIETLLTLYKAAGHEVPEIKSTTAVLDTSKYGEWLKENGYRRLAASYGFGEFNQDRALQCSAFFACVKFLSEDIASLPLFLMRRLGKRGQEGIRERAVDHALFETLHDQFNPELGAMEGREAITAHAVMCGVGYAQIVRPSPLSCMLYPLMPWDVTRDEDRNGSPIFRVRQKTGGEKIFPPEEIFELRGFNINTKTGVSILTIGRDVLKLALQQSEYAERFFENDHTPSIALAHPKGIGPDAARNIKRAWKESVASHDVAVLAEGMTIQRIGQTNTESQLLEQRAEQVLEVARLFRMPAYKLGYTRNGGQSYASIEQRNIEYYTETLRPWCVRWEQAIRRCLLTREERRTLYAEHSIEGILRGDFKSQVEAWARMLEKGAYSINEVRRMLNLNPIDGGDAHFLQLNMSTIQNIADGLNVQLPAQIGE